jgi:transcriptional regulator with XRE-family HTH domain
MLKNLGKHIRELRKARKLTLEKLEERSNLDSTYIGGIERGERNPSINSLLQIAKALDLGICDLLGPVFGPSGAEQPSDLIEIVCLLHGRTEEELKWIKTAMKDILRWHDSIGLSFPNQSRNGFNPTSSESSEKSDPRPRNLKPRNRV